MNTKTKFPQAQSNQNQETNYGELEESDLRAVWGGELVYAGAVDSDGFPVYPLIYRDTTNGYLFDFSSLSREPSEIQP
ncbi:MAG: hypothetical protein KME30_12060 [Iphinoe sp. HA4291-MV1]|nr:hypothetical protein [Iphinoe sp. HA4291-MV1]